MKLVGLDYKSKLEYLQTTLEHSLKILDIDSLEFNYNSISFLFNNSAKLFNKPLDSINYCLCEASKEIQSIDSMQDRINCRKKITEFYKIIQSINNAMDQNTPIQNYNYINKVNDSIIESNLIEIFIK
ncbi:hypothetical protein IMX26_12430 [Clostridium sp. 'deep sea']|nr:hypothetical protein IMX26_12430 [Clostridium sp. 'deep sea']